MNYAFFDVESYRNFFLLRVRPQGGEAIAFRLYPGQSFDTDTKAAIHRVMDAYTVVSFNGLNYDVPVICGALCGFTCERLKELTNEIIVEEKKPWELGLPEWKPRDHIDIREVLPGSESQKTYAGRIHHKTMRDLPYEPEALLAPNEIQEVDIYNDNDLDVLEALFDSVAPQLKIRVDLGVRYGIDLRSKSDAQVGEAIIKVRCEQALGRKLYKSEIDWNLKFRYDPPPFISFTHPKLVEALEIVRNAIFGLGASGRVEMPPGLEGLSFPIGDTVYRMGIGGLHSSEKSVAYHSDEFYQLEDIDVESYYPQLILNSGQHPEALGPTMLVVYGDMKKERLADKKLDKALIKAGKKDTPEWLAAHSGNEGGKVAINGPFGKLNSPYSILFAPKMFIATTITGQLSLLMLAEWHENVGIRVISANTDGLVVLCPRDRRAESQLLIYKWEKLTNLTMETTQYSAIYSRDINNYIAVKTDGTVKRKGEYSTAGLIEKKNPDVEICGDAVSEFLSKGTPLLYTIGICRDIRKFVTIRMVAGGAVKLWGEGPRKNALVRDMLPVLQANGWEKEGRLWYHVSWRARFDTPAMLKAQDAYKLCFQPQQPEYLSKVIRFYYSTQSPGPIIYNTNGNTVGKSYGAKPCMTLPDEFPTDIDYGYYVGVCEEMLKKLGWKPNVAS